MKTAVISDVHGNYPALLSVMDDARANGANNFIFVGDYIFDLPYSNEATRLIMETENSRVVRGNKETYLKKMSGEDQKNWTFDQMGAVYQTYRDLEPDVFDYLINLDDEIFISLGADKTAYAVHTPKFFIDQPKFHCSSHRYHKKMLERPFTREEYLSEFNGFVNSSEYSAAFNKINADVIIFGHNHLQSRARCGDKLIVNPGSCGQPLDFNNAAAYTILDTSDGEIKIIERRVKYDVEPVIKKAMESVLYEKGKTWLGLVFLALRTGRDYFGFFFEIANQIAESKNEDGTFYTNSTWSEANELFSQRFKTDSNDESRIIRNEK